MEPSQTWFYQHVDTALQRSEAAVSLDRFVRAWRTDGASWDTISLKIVAHYVSDGPTAETLRRWFTCRICNAETVHKMDCPNRAKEEN